MKPQGLRWLSCLFVFSWGAGCWDGRSSAPHVHSATYLCKSLTSGSAPILSWNLFFFLVAPLPHGAMGIFLGRSPVPVPQGNGELGCPRQAKHPSSRHPPGFLPCEMWRFSCPPQAASACPCPGQGRNGAGAGGEGSRAPSWLGDRVEGCGCRAAAAGGEIQVRVRELFPKAWKR